MNSDPVHYQTDSTNDYRVKPPPPCEGCGGHAHGSVNLALACVTMHLRGARLQMLSPDELAEWQAWKKIQGQVRSLSPSTVHLRGR